MLLCSPCVGGGLCPHGPVPLCKGCPVLPVLLHSLRPPGEQSLLSRGEQGRWGVQELQPLALPAQSSTPVCSQAGAVQALLSFRSSLFPCLCVDYVASTDENPSHRVARNKYFLKICIHCPRIFSPLRGLAHGTGAGFGSQAAAGGARS